MTNTTEDASKLVQGNPLTSPLFRSLVGLTKTAGFLKHSEFAFFRSISSKFDAELPGLQSQVLDLLNASLNASLASKGVPHVTMDSLHDLLENHSALISDALDGLLEKTDVQLDLLTGKRKQKDLVVVPPSVDAPALTSSSRSNRSSSSIILRPQVQFHEKPDNSNRPFVRIIKYKPHAKRPLDYGLPGSTEISDDMESHLESMGITKTSSALFSLPHPYEFEIRNLEYPEFMFQESPEILYETMEKTPFTWVDTEEKLDELANLLCSVKEIAVDLEHHDLRSFQGFTCLIQVSTRKEDFIIDSLALRHRLHVLNESFADPNIVKVFHGADSDVQWLQRDFGVYIVNLFDTYHASHILELQGHGLAYLLKNYCNVHTDKRYQRADWRIRPLTPEMMYYARSDTHYLLYIYDRMRNEILSKGDPITRNLLNVTLSRSAETALKVYEKDVYDTEGGSGSTGWKNTLRKYNRPMNVQQFAVYQAIHAWRDTTAREADESIHYVLPNHMLFNLVEVMPNNAQQALACCSPTPTFVRLYANELVALIDHARVETLRNEQVKQVELNKLKEAMEAKERDWEKRKREGPMHVRFDASAEREDSQAPPAPKKIKAVEGSDVSTASTASFPKTVISVPGSQKTISGKERTSSRVQVAAQNSSSLLGSKWNKETLPSKWEEAQAIKDSMMLEAPDSHSILETLHSVMEIPAIKEKEEGEVDTSIPMQTDDSQSQESLEDVADDDEFSAKSEDEPALKSKTLVINDDSFEVVANVRQKKKKKKGKKNKGLVASLKSSGEVEVAEEAFDFKTAKSSVAQFLETVKEQTSWNK